MTSQSSFHSGGVSDLSSSVVSDLICTMTCRLYCGLAHGH